MSRAFFTVVLLLCSFISFSQDSKKQQWVDSVVSKLKAEEKIGQMIMTLVSPDYISLADQSRQVKAGKMGGIYIDRIGVVNYVRWVNELQSQSKIPLFVGADVAHNYTRTFDSVMNFYDPLVESMGSDSLRKSVDVELARQMKILNVHLDFAIEAHETDGLNIAKVEISPGTSNQKINDEVKKVLARKSDILLVPTNPDQVIKAIVKISKKDKVLSAQIDLSVRKILSRKYEVGLAQNKFINADNLYQRLYFAEAKLLKQKVAEELVMIVKNDSELIPIQTVEDKNFASISIGSSENAFTHYLSKYAFFHHESILNQNDTTGLSKRLKGNDIIIIGLFSQQLAEHLIEFIKKISKEHQVIICNFTQHLNQDFENSNTIIEAFVSDQEFTQAVAQIIFGGISGRRKIVESVSDSTQIVEWITTKSLNRFSYQLPEAAGMDSRTLDKIEAIANEAISIGATPCVNVLVAKDGKVVYEKSFGTLTYESKNAVTDETIFDLASITKVAATLQVIMHLQEKGMIDLNKKVSVYLPELKGSNKEDFTIKDILTHQAGLWPFLPFWTETVKDSITWKKYYNKNENKTYPFAVSKNLFATKSIKDSLWHWIIKSRVIEKPIRTPYSYKYSDMGFYILQHLAEKTLAMPLEDFLQKNIYEPMGSYTMGYLPLRKFSSGRIAPTEKDTLFRKSLLIGYVHDQGAAMHGGIAGHAGLFSTGNDLAKLGQMWLNKGTYGGKQFFKPETIDLFTSKQYENSSRALGWDKAILNNPSISMYASPKTFGHTGFTGTSIWVDPEYNLVFVFLSNRVYPDMNNRKILNANIRPRIQDVVYQSIFEYCKNHDDSLKPNELKSGLTVKP
jgi:CubicO group peptidase (beta-lactamase class C family)